MEKIFTCFDPKRASELIYKFLRENNVTEIKIVLLTPEKGV